ncbi:BTAD domain-containing putative transcriptional regulator [Amycolatopsis sp. NPDC051061]|uniref:ATP-binding protein n=1 Tax=Amycolatopsis sp. NPDC051061 TaxID=3155042 RepID=UPI003431ECDE
MTIELVLLPRVAHRGREITSPRLGGLLALLADDLRTGCGTARLIEGIWSDRQPEHPAKALQILVSRARAQLGPGVIEATPAGYRLALAEDQVDASALLLSATACARLSRAGDHEAALAHAEGGLALGNALVETGGDDPLAALRAARASTCRWLVRAQALCHSRLGRAAEALDTLLELAADRPHDEELLIELLRSEAETTGPSAALARYEAYRRALRDDLGTDPGPALQEAYQRLLQGETPPARHGVAQEPNPLLGRDADLAAVTGLVRTSRVTSIVGAGGLGKTRLAHTVSRRAEQRIVHFVSLAGVSGDDDVLAEVASAVGSGETLRESAGRDSVLHGIAKAFEPGPGLLVLDNCEHVVDGVAELVRALVATTAELRVLTTSRAPLGLSSESVYPLPELSPETAAELFRARARAARPDVELPEGVILDLCAHLDGLPLAVELAAARVRVMSVTEIAHHLDDRFALLRGGPRDTPARHHTLHAVIDWSWALLEPRGQTALRALSVFPGGFTADAARRLLGDDVLDVLEHLAGHSLLKVQDTNTGTRFRMLETVREFSTRRREEAGETESVTDRFLAWARDFGVQHSDALFGDGLTTAMARVRAEQDNLVLALRLGLDRPDGATVAATCAALAGLWTCESSFTRMASLAADTAWTLSHFHPEPPLVEATRTASVLCAVNSFLLQGPSPLRALATLRRLPPAPPGTLAGAAEVVLRAVTGADPVRLFELCGSGDAVLAGMANGVAGYLLESEDLPGALVAARRMVAAFEDLRSPWMLAVAHARVGELCLQLEQGEEARRALTAALSVLDELGTWSGAARVRGALVFANLLLGATDEAEHWLDQAMLSGDGDQDGTSMVDVGVRAEIRLARGDVEAGLRLWRHAAERLRERRAGDAAPGSAAWAWEIQAVTVIAHARHGRLDLIDDLVASLPATVAAESAQQAGLSVYGALLLALATADLVIGDPERTVFAVRMSALAERLRFARGFQPTMSGARARTDAEQADGPAYAAAVAAYAGLDRVGLLEVARTLLRARERLSARDPA